MYQLREYLTRQRFLRGVYFYSEVFFLSLSLIGLFGVLTYLLVQLSASFTNPSFVFIPIGVGLFGLYYLVRLWMRAIRRFTHWDIVKCADFLERDYLFQKELRGELRAAAAVSISQGVSGSDEFQKLHLNRWEKKVHELPQVTGPSRRFFYSGFLAFLTLGSLFTITQYWQWELPKAGLAWVPSGYEVKLPGNSQWKSEVGVIRGLEGSLVRFSPPNLHGLKAFLFTEAEGHWNSELCQDYCYLQLNKSSRYAVGTLFSRSAFFPIQVTKDEAPKSVLMALVDGEFSPRLSLKLSNVKKLLLKGLASDDLQIIKVDLIHKSDSEEVLQTWKVEDLHWKWDGSINLEDWKAGQHSVFLRVTDRSQSENSEPITILFEDEESLREKRILSLRSLIEEWVHVLGDLIETQTSGKVVPLLEKRLSQINYSGIDSSPLVVAYSKELQRLSERISRWIKFSPDMSNIGDLISRTERQIIYGLSLLFQEKTGSIEDSSRSLNAAKKNLGTLLDDIKNGKLDLQSKEIQQAFDKLSSQLKELQDKIRNMPQGPQDEMFNREALDQQLAESESIEDRIEEIKKQLESGDQKGALRELESLLNQLSILTKEMESSLGQWKESLDQGSIQSSQKFSKSLEELAKKQEKLLRETEELKAKQEKLKEEASRKWEPENPKKAEEMHRAIEDKKKIQNALSEEFRKSREAFDKEMAGTEWADFMRSDEMKEGEDSIADQMEKSSDALSQKRLFDSIAAQKSALEYLKKSQEQQSNAQKQIQQMGQQQQAGQRIKEENIETLATESKVERERRKKIMESLRQSVDGRFQKSHERYFEDLLQR